MEKIQKTINDPCLIDLRVGMNSSTINLESTTTNENISINCEYDRSVKLTILYEPSNYPINDNEESSERYGGTDNWTHGEKTSNHTYINDDVKKVKEWIESYKDIDDPDLIYKLYEENNIELYESLIKLEYYKESHEEDSIYVNDLGNNEDNDYPMFGKDEYGNKINWCKCVLDKDWKLDYKIVLDNPYSTPRIAYFEHKTTNERLKYGEKAGYKVYDNLHNQSYKTWGVIVVQSGNPNVDDTEIEEKNLHINRKIEDGPLYSIGIISDSFFDIDDINNSQYKTDLRNALEYFYNNNVKFICNLGDLCTTSHKDLIKFEEFYRLYAYTKKIRMFTCLGEYDYMKFNINQNTYNQINKFNMNNIYKDLKYFEYDGVWNQLGSGERNIKGKTNYYFTYKHKDVDIEDIFIYLSVDYGVNKYSSSDYLSKAKNKLDYDDKYVKELIPFAKEAGYDQEVDGNFDYQFYNSNTLIWLKDIIENNLDKHIFVFMHHGLPHKAGNGTSYNTNNFGIEVPYFSKIYPYDTHSAIMKSANYSGSNSLCGLQFYFLNYLNNKYKNVTWFSGHSGYSWKDGMLNFINDFTGDQYLNFCNKEFNIYKPTGNECYQNPSNSKSLSKDYKEYIYTRIPKSITKKDEIGNTIPVILNDDPIGISAWNIHIPSLSQPITRNSNKKLYNGSEGAILDIYENGYKIRQILFKDTYSTNKCLGSYNYINTVIGEKRILFT